VNSSARSVARACFGTSGFHVPLRPAGFGAALGPSSPPMSSRWMAWCPTNHRRRSRGLTMVEAEHSAEPGPADDLAIPPRLVGRLLDQLPALGNVAGHPAPPGMACRAPYPLEFVRRSPRLFSGHHGIAEGPPSPGFWRRKKSSRTGLWRSQPPSAQRSRPSTWRMSRCGRRDRGSGRSRRSPGSMPRCRRGSAGCRK
jgi:hypothetical protein